LCNGVPELAKMGYGSNFSISDEESLLSLASGPFGSLLGACPRPQAIIVHHSYGASASLPAGTINSVGFMPHAQYFPATLLQEFDLDNIPYFGSFATGCTGLLSLVEAAAGICAYSRVDPIACITADIKPPGSTFDSLKEKILTSDCSSGFLIGREKMGYEVLGIAYYSTKRPLVPLVEVVKRTVQMARELISALNIETSKSEFVIHYPNLFRNAWDMVTGYLQLTGEPQLLDGLAERAHCLSSDPIISLAKRHEGKAGRLHLVVNFGSGLHLGVGLFREEHRVAAGE
jgi:hypothetical protein